MAKLTLTDFASLTGGSAVTTLNNNNAATETAMENTLSRDGTSPNAMNSNLDMNSFRIQNLIAAVGATEPVRKAELDSELDTLELTVSNIATTAQGYANAAAASYDSFDDRYLGVFATAPTLDNDGNALLTGALYFDSTTSLMRVWSGSQWNNVVPSTSGNNFAITMVFDGGGSVITTGIKGDVEIPFNCVLSANRLFADQTGSIVVDIWKDAYANFPPTGADSITASAKPTISSSNKSQDTTLTGWTTSVVQGSILRFNVDSCATITRATLSLTANRT